MLTGPQSEWYSVMSLPDARYQTPMSATDPKEQVRRSKNLAAGFALSHVIKSEAHIDDCIRLLKHRLQGFASSKTPVHLDEWFNYMAFDIIGEVVFSQRFGFLEAGKDLGGSIANSRLLVPYVTMAGFFRTFHRLTVGNPLITDWNLMPTQHILDTTLRALEARKKNEDVREDILSLWLKQHERYPEKLSEKELHGCVNMTVGAASDTVSASLQSFFYHLIRHPQYLKVAKKEITDADLTDDVVSYAEASKLPFLQACVRLHLSRIQQKLTSVVAVKGRMANVPTSAVRSCSCSACERCHYWGSILQAKRMFSNCPTNASPAKAL